MKYGFIGAGNICTAVITGAVKGGVSPGDIFVYDTDAAKAERLSDKTGAQACDSLRILAEAETVFFGLKPFILPGVLREYAPMLTKRAGGAGKPVIVSFAAGVDIAALNSFLPGMRVLRVMPNLNCAVCAGISAICANANCGGGDVAEINKFMSLCGGVTELNNEKHFDIFGVLGGSTPAYTYVFIDSLARAALSLGMPKQQALDIAAQSVMGSAKLLLESGSHPWELADRVCSPGGLTVEGIRALQEGGFEHAAMQAVIRAVNKIS